MGRAVKAQVVKALVALVVAGMLALTGCSNPNHAATVDGVPIALSEAEALAKYVQSGGASTATGLIVLSRIGASIAQRQGLEFSADAREAATASALPPELAADAGLAGFTADYVTTLLVSQELGQEGFVQAVSEADVVVNPRLGSWDPETLAVAPGTGSLSDPAPAS